jgi:hypothetical protein
LAPTHTPLALALPTAVIKSTAAIAIAKNLFLCGAPPHDHASPVRALRKALPKELFSFVSFSSLFIFFFFHLLKLFSSKEKV